VENGKRTRQINACRDCHAFANRIWRLRERLTFLSCRFFDRGPALLTENLQWCYGIRVNAYGGDFLNAMNTINDAERELTREVNACQGSLGPKVEASCKGYADNAVKQVQEFRKLAQTTGGCSLNASDGVRFATNWDQHFGWCLAGFRDGKPIGAWIPAEGKARDEKIKACQAASNKQR
jgi:hypothetical protein